MRRLLVLVAALALAGCGGEEQGGSERDSGLREVRALGDFTRVFNEDNGSPRLLVLLSPT